MVYTRLAYEKSFFFFDGHCSPPLQADLQGAACHAVAPRTFFQWTYGSAIRLVVRCKDGDIAVQVALKGRGRATQLQVYTFPTVRSEPWSL